MVRPSRRTFVIEYLRSFNLFPSYPSSTNDSDIQNELLSTRVFLVLLILCITLLGIYTSQENITETITVNKPNFDHFRALIQAYPKTLNCPCENIAITQKTFISLYPDFHHVCTSDFVSRNWSAHITATADVYVSKDFSYVGGPFFQALAAFCNLARAGLNNALLTFNSTRFISTTALDENPFMQRVQSVIDAFKTNTIGTFIQTFNVIRETTYSNSLMSGLFTNANVSVHVVFLLASIYFESYNRGACHCFLTPTCIEPLTRQVKNSSMKFTIPGLYIGCYLVEAIRSSSLACFYNQSCLDQVEFFLGSPTPYNATVLDPSLSKFAVNSTIDTLLSKAMIERWNQNISWSNYYEKCKPATCTYSFATRYNFWYIITTIIGLIGGVIKVMRVVIPRAIKFTRRRICGGIPTTLTESTTVPEVIPWWRKIIRLNIFESVPPSTDIAKIRLQVISTRLFVCLFVTCIALLLTYLSIETVTTTYTVASPSYNQFLTLYAKYSEYSLSCPCTSAITEYQYILQVDFKLHPVCYSEFVQFPWLSFPTLTAMGFSYGGALWSVAALFQTLSAYCRLTASHIQTNIQILNEIQMVTSQALSELEFHARINATTNSFKTSITNSFLRSLSLITNTSRANGIVSAQATNFYPYVGGTTSLTISENSSLLNFLYSHHEGCYCLPTVSCQNIIPLTYDGNLNIDQAIRFYSDCLPDEGVRASSLRSLYDQILVNNLHAWFDFPLNTARMLHMNDLIQFTTESVVKDILANMMVNQWNVTSFHDVHYEKCRPQTCTYIRVAHRSLLIIFTTLIGLVGGLASILQTIVPFLMQTIFALHASRTRKLPQEQAVEPVHFSPRSFVFKWLQKLSQLNLFPSLPPATDEPQIKTELISTRLYVLLITSLILILIIYSARRALEKTETIVWPTVKEYRSLYDSHSATLACPCTSISIDHSAFIKLSPSFHQVCSSDLVTSHWIYGIIADQTYEFLYNATSSTWYDFRLLGGSSFLTIALLCDVASTTVSDGLTSFGSSSIITSKVMSENELNAQGLALMDLFIVTMTNEFINSLRTIRETSQANALISGQGTNVQMTWKIDERLPAAHYNTFLNCSCAVTPLCSQEAGIYDPNGVFQFPIPGIRIGCYVVEATLQSSLSAFYSQAYIDDLRNWTKFIDPDFPVNALNSSLNRNFTTNTTIEYIMEQLMVDEWISKNVSFPDYYAQCQAYECKYTYIERNDIAYVISTLISVIGGLNVVLHFLVPRIVTIIRRYYLKRRARIVPTTIQVESRDIQ